MARGDAIGISICLLIASGLRLGMILNHSDQLIVDRDAYLGVAQGIAEGRGYCSPSSNGPTAFRPPIYPLILGLGMTAFPPAVVVATLNLVTGLLTVWLTANLGWRLQLGPWRFLAALVAAVDPLLLQYSPQPMTESICTCLATFWLWSLAVMPASEHSRRSGLGMLSGFAFGLLVLSRPTFWPIAPVCGLLWTMAIIKPGERSKRFDIVARGLWTITGTILTVAPWVIRNWIVFGLPILTTTHGGYTLLLGNNPVFYREVISQPFGTTWPDASQKAWEAELESQLIRHVGQSTSELERDAWQSHAARAFMVEDPAPVSK